MPALRTFDAPMPQPAFASAELEYVKIDMNARTVTGFVRFLDAQGNALRSDAFALDFNALPLAVKQAGATFVHAVLAGIGLPSGTDTVS